jgi:hypothetical protein
MKTYKGGVKYSDTILKKLDKPPNDITLSWDALYYMLSQDGELSIIESSIHSNSGLIFVFTSDIDINVYQAMKDQTFSKPVMSVILKVVRLQNNMESKISRKKWFSTNKECEFYTDFYNEAFIQQNIYLTSLIPSGNKICPGILDFSILNDLNLKKLLTMLLSKKMDSTTKSIIDELLTLKSPDGWGLIAMEYIQSESSKNPAKKIIYDIFAKLIILLVQCKVVHCDLHQDNILIIDNKPWIIDFGRIVYLNQYKFACTSDPTLLSFLNRIESSSIEMTKDNIVNCIQLIAMIDMDIMYKIGLYEKTKIYNSKIENDLVLAKQYAPDTTLEDIKGTVPFPRLKSWVYVPEIDSRLPREKQLQIQNEKKDKYKRPIIYKLLNELFGEDFATDWSHPSDSPNDPDIKNIVWELNPVDINGIYECYQEHARGKITRDYINELKATNQIFSLSDKIPPFPTYERTVSFELSEPVTKSAPVIVEPAAPGWCTMRNGLCILAAAAATAIAFGNGGKRKRKTKKYKKSYGKIHRRI